MEFDSEQAGRIAYNSYVRRVGFSTRSSVHQREEMVGNGCPTRCERREDKKKKKKSAADRSTSPTDCPDLTNFDQDQSHLDSPETVIFLKKEGTYKGKKFNGICHFFGYQARGSLPSKFDCDYAYVLGHIGYHILAAGLNGYMATVTNLKNPVNKWRCGAAPITSMMTVKRYGRGHGAATLGKPALHPAAVDLKGKSYGLLRQNATKFLMDDVYRNPGPLQFEGPGADSKPVTLCVEDQDYMGRIKQLKEHLDKVRSIVKPGCSQDVLKAALSAMASVTDILSVISSPSSGSTPY
ncbi:pyrophosphate--fructose 6-phosphate 1-phosphotransferase subunit alpha-like [Olea europaea var. sylvestris]|uniref:pyrophosphate--fructose 6-phosphate 1-phosphotransferase subunit alpha-like n=1 Tax=Olea europaea var. sylvestris TaxID=158386 RepID=UPI000C1D1F0A|nr:pyrophosphate--fructose 6-phosphate 1-phosphotransferase subunit alpha-like [Olea europaea var. sylvestris]